MLVHSRIRTGVPCAVTVPARRALEALFAEAARRGLLRVPVADAAARVVAADIGVTLSLIGGGDPLLSGAVREAVLYSIIETHQSISGEQPRATRPKAAVTLRTALTDDASGLTPGEAALLTELLDLLGWESQAG